MEKSTRNRSATTLRIVDALEQVLAERGLEGLGINIIAEKAAVSKVLIYRYFGGMEGLLEYYVRLGRVVPHYAPAWLEQIRPDQPRDLAGVWSAQAVQLFRQFRSSKATRELLKATVEESDSVANVISENLDAELTTLIDQFTFINDGDRHAISAVILGGLSFLTIQAQLNRTVIGLNPRSEDDWQRIEEAVKVVYKALNRSVMDSPKMHINVKPASVAAIDW